MPIKLKYITHICNVVSRQINDRFKPLTVHFIVHHQGERVEALGMAGQDILWHPAGDTAMQILAQAKHSEESSLLGTAIAHENIFFGLATRDAVLSLCSLNTDQYESQQDVLCHAYHMGWHAIDSYLYHQWLSSERQDERNVIIRKRNALEMTRANLMADVFSVTMATLNGKVDVARKMSKMRSLNALTVGTGLDEQYPFPMATETTEHVLRKVRSKAISKKKYIDTALSVAQDIGDVYRDDDYKEWLSFSEPAQDMAWRGMTPSQILGAAMNTSENTGVRGMAHLLSDITDIKPQFPLEKFETYNAYANDEINENMHEKFVDSIFEDVIARGLEKNSSEPLKELADRQNVGLINGKVLGWCASALQSSAQVFERALANGISADEVARKSFDKERHAIAWDSLKNLSHKIIKQHREGETITLDTVKSMTKDDRNFASLHKSVKQTQHHLSQQPAATPKPSVAPAPAAPQAVPALATPGPGGGTTRIRRTRQAPDDAQKGSKNARRKQTQTEDER